MVLLLVVKLLSDLNLICVRKLLDIYNLFNKYWIIKFIWFKKIRWILFEKVKNGEL